MDGHQFVACSAQSISRGVPLSQEQGLGTLTLPGFVRDVVARFGTREALVQARGESRIERWHYNDLWDRSVEVAQALIACGLGKGDRVGILMTNRAEFLSAVFGTALAGGTAAPLSTFSTAHELEHLVGTSACSILLFEQRVLHKDFAEMLLALDGAIPAGAAGRPSSLKFPFLRHVVGLDMPESAGAIETWKGFLARGSDVSADQVTARADSVRPSDPGALFFSSGSTNKPKAILSAHRGVALQMWRMREQQALRDGVRSWTANGFFWSGNFTMVLGATLAAGGTLVLQSTFDAKAALELIAYHRVGFVFAWPHQWAQLESADNWLDADLSSLEYIDVDSAIARHPSVRSRWIEPRHCYGNTETFTLVTAYPANVTREQAHHSHGVPLPGNAIKIVDPLEGGVVAVGQRGEIAVKGPTLMLGYLGVPLDETLDDEGYFRTGDGGYIDEHGRLYWEGRLNDIIKTGGANVSPVEIDDVIRALPGVKIAQTVGVPHDTLGEIVVTCIVAHEGVMLTEDQVRDFAKTKLASYKVPRRVIFPSHAEWQLTGTAKIKTAELRKLAAQMLDANPTRK
jgi:fatty-acyl-CoA synthase